jgi:hypothetical protein
VPSDAELGTRALARCGPNFAAAAVAPPGKFTVMVSPNVPSNVIVSPVFAIDGSIASSWH